MIEDKKTIRTIKTDTPHNIIMENRGRVSISGVDDVESFNEDEILLHTRMGALLVRGNDLHINKLNTELGEVSVEGTVNSLEYTESKSGKGAGIISRMFR